MINLDNLTLLGMDGAGNRPDIIKALRYSCRGINYKKVLLLSSNLEIYPDTKDIELVSIPKLTYDDWNRFTIKELYKYIDSEFYLFIDTDGFVINPKFWTNKFLEYDYIGAAWRYPDHIFTSVVDQKIKDRPQDKVNLVGNGGFTLRSKRLLDLAKDCPDTRYNPEDVYLCQNNYDYFKDNGIKYAPVDVANRFSQDPLYNINSTFGFHGNKEYIRSIS